MPEPCWGVERRCCVAQRYREASSLREDLEYLDLDDAAEEAAAIILDILKAGCPACRQHTLSELAKLAASFHAVLR